MIDCMLHVPLHSSQMDFQGLLVVCRAHASLHLLALFYPSIASVVQNPLLSILTSILISLSRCNCSSTLLPSQASCHALTSLIWWSLKSMVSMVFGLVFQAPCLLPLIHVLSVYSTPSPVCYLYLCDVWFFYQHVPMYIAFSSLCSPILVSQLVNWPPLAFWLL